MPKNATCPSDLASLTLHPLARTPLKLPGDAQGAAVVGSTSALFGALAGLGIPKDSVVRYENDVKAGKFLVLAQGTPEQVNRAKDILAASKPTTVAIHST